MNVIDFFLGILSKETIVKLKVLLKELLSRTSSYILDIISEMGNIKVLSNTVESGCYNFSFASFKSA